MTYFTFIFATHTHPQTHLFLSSVNVICLMKEPLKQFNETKIYCNTQKAHKKKYLLSVTKFIKKK